MTKKTGNDLFIVDNSDKDWKVLNHLSECSEISHKFDIATGYFEIGALSEGLTRVGQLLDDSIEREKQKNDFLSGVDQIVHPPPDAATLAAEQMVQKEQLKAQKKAATATKKRAAHAISTGASSLFDSDNDLDGLAAASRNSV